MNKACPVVLRRVDSTIELLAFQHPIAGKQIVKGTIEPGENIESACERELIEESGLKIKSDFYLGSWNSGYKNQVWGFCKMQMTETVPDQWIYHTDDGGGLEFMFFWQSLDTKLSREWHPLFVGAIDYIKAALTKKCSGPAKAGSLI